ncbi:hypothetical protein [Piscirickettsia salmonis]|uniref:hypothetical protein n=1 Tax=Piscirickettsia salmonis TaxID=1238 RepID=UPI0012BACBC5|nr:hypothetical protein [Piscirickettsia salmonis]
MASNQKVTNIGVGPGPQHQYFELEKLKVNTQHDWKIRKMKLAKTAIIGSIFLWVLALLIDIFMPGSYLSVTAILTGSTGIITLILGYYFSENK